MLAREDARAFDILLMLDLSLLRGLILAVELRHDLLVRDLPTTPLEALNLPFLQVFDQTFGGML